MTATARTHYNDSMAHFSLQHVTGHRQPRVYDNTERMQAFRASQPVEFANTTLPAMFPPEPPTQADPPDYRYFTEHSYDDLSHGY